MTVSTQISPLDELSGIISKDASIVSSYLAENDIPQPSLDSHGRSSTLPSNSPQHVQEARQRLISGAIEMLHLAAGPSEYLPNLATGIHYVSCLQWLCQYNIFHLVPLEGAISYTNLAAAAKVSEARLKSIMRMAMTRYLFLEQADGANVVHSATSAHLARNDDVHAYAHYMCSKTAPMALQMTAAHQKWGTDSTKTYETAYNIAFDTDLSFFDHISRDQTRTETFAKYMRNVRSSETLDIKHLVAGFKWQDLPQGAKLVDVGGSTGTAAIALAQAYPTLSCTVQDLPGNAVNGRKTASETLPENISARINFQGHDFMKPQPIQGADVYLLRMILHDWSDDDAVKILCNIAAAMAKTTSRLLIMDTVLPRPGSVTVLVERISRSRDLTMMQSFNSKERDLEDWKILLDAAVPALGLVNVVQPFGSAMSVLEVTLKSLP